MHMEAKGKHPPECTKYNPKDFPSRLKPSFQWPTSPALARRTGHIRRRGSNMTGLTSQHGLKDLRKYRHTQETIHVFSVTTGSVSSCPSLAMLVSTVDSDCGMVSWAGRPPPFSVSTAIFWLEHEQRGWLSRMVSMPVAEFERCEQGYPSQRIC